MGLLLVGAPTVSLLRALGVEGLSFRAFASIKTGIAGVLAVYVTRWVVVPALAESVPRSTT
jgi:hypothetical protein